MTVCLIKMMVLIIIMVAKTFKMSYEFVSFPFHASLEKILEFL